MLTVKVSAAEAPTIINNNNVEISLEDYEKLKTLWSDNEIYNMKEDEVIEELEFYNSIRSRKTETYYIKKLKIYMVLMKQLKKQKVHYCQKKNMTLLRKLLLKQSVDPAVGKQLIKKYKLKY